MVQCIGFGAKGCCQCLRHLSNTVSIEKIKRYLTRKASGFLLSPMYSSLTGKQARHQSLGCRHTTSDVANMRLSPRAQVRKQEFSDNSFLSSDAGPSLTGEWLLSVCVSQHALRYSLLSESKSQFIMVCYQTQDRVSCLLCRRIRVSRAQGVVFGAEGVGSRCGVYEISPLTCCDVKWERG